MREGRRQTGEDPSGLGQPQPPPGRYSALLVGVISLVAYLLSAGPTIYWLDSGELTAAAFGLGVAHPPGHPLASLVGRLCCLIPAGTIAFRVTLASALEAAAAAALLTLLVLRLLRPLPLASRLRGPCAALAGLTLGLSYPIWFQAVRAEVYALNLLILVGAAHELLAWDQDHDRRRLLTAALLSGLGLCNHHLLVLLALPPFLLHVLFRRPSPGHRRVAAMVLAAGLLGLVPLAYLPLRARQAPTVDWGAPRTADRFVWTVSARAFQQTVGRVAGQPWQHRLGGAAFGLLGGLGPVASLLALGGLYLLGRRRTTRRAALLLAGLIGANLVAPLLVGFDPFNPDAYGYLAVAVAFLAPGLAVLAAALAGLAAGWPRGGRVAAPALIALAALLPVQQGFANARACDLRDHFAADETGRAQLAGPPGALLLTSFYQTLFNAWALQVTGDLRPDLQVLHRHFLDQPGYLEDLERRDPALVASARRWATRGQPALDDLAAAAAQRPVLVELDLDLPPGLEGRLGPGGLLAVFDGATSAASVRRHLRQVTAWRAAVGPVVESETRRALVWAHYVLARHGCRRREPELGRTHLRWALELAPDDQRLTALAGSCAGR